MKHIRILHNVMSVGQNSVGLGMISVSLAKAQHSLDQDVSIYCLDNKKNIQWASNNHEFPIDQITGFNLIGPKKLWLSSEMIKNVKNDINGKFDLIHQHGLWTGISRATLHYSKEKKIPTIIAPHGSLNSWALNHSKWKKKLALKLFEQSNLKLASCLHATSENEISDFRNFGLVNPIAYIENGINEKYLTSNGNAKDFRDEYLIPPDKRILLFLSRISPKKGLDMLVEAIYNLKEYFSDWYLIIAGIDEFNHKKEVNSLIQKLNLQDKIKIIGSLFGKSKDNAFAAAELFILPSYSEGSPMVILDSLAAGVPVITTKASTWQDLTTFNCGWWTDISTHAISDALIDAIKLNKQELKKKGERGKELIMSKYIWSQLANKTISVYKWILGCDDRPDFVHLY